MRILAWVGWCALAFACTAIISTCHGCNLAPLFDEMQTKATAASAVPLAVNFRIGTVDTAFGESHAKGNWAALSKEMCDRPVIHQRYVMAHELGHIIAQRLQPELTRTVGLRPVDPEVEEMLADVQASRLFTAREHEQLLNYFDELCALKARYGCEHGARWRWAKIH